MDFVESCYNHGLDVPALKIRVKWGLSVPWKYLQKLGKNMKHGEKLTCWVDPRKEVYFFCLFILRDSHPSKSLEFKRSSGKETNIMELRCCKVVDRIMAISICATLTAQQSGGASRWTRLFIERRFGLWSSYGGLVTQSEWCRNAP